jgi:hypothetical protein
MGGGEWDGGLESVGCVRMVARMGAGRGSCGQQIILFTFQLSFLTFRQCLNGSWELLGLNWAQIGHHGSKLTYLGVTLGASRPDFG